MKKILTILIVIIAFYKSADAQILDGKIEKLVKKYDKQIVEWRHWFHEHAELSNREFKTAERIASILKEIGLTPQIGVAKTGVVAVLKGGKAGKVVALRADIDGLPVKERVQLPWASSMMGEFNGEKVPVMHACGHDTHVSILLGVAKILYEMREDIPGTVKFIFQPAEEGAPNGEEGGAKLMVKEGVLDNPKVDAIFGLHISAQTTVGNINIRPEGIMAASNSFKIIINGKQTHGSTPWTGADPIVTAAHMINNIQTIVSRNSELTKQAVVVTVGSIHGGVRSNIIPESLYMLGTIRTLDKGMQKIVLRRMHEVVENIAKANNVTAEIDIDEGYPITYNDPSLYKKMLPTLQRIAGDDHVHITQAITGAEDFSFFQEKVPGVYFFIGGCPIGKDVEDAAPHHTPDFYVDDSGMTLGLKSMSSLALDFLVNSQ